MIRFMDNKWVFLGLLISFFIILIVPSMSILTLGGITLLFGAWYVYTGNIFYSVISYGLADICWIINAIEHKDYSGSVMIGLGILAGLAVMYKMQSGIFNKTIRK